MSDNAKLMVAAAMLALPFVLGIWMNATGDDVDGYTPVQQYNRVASGQATYDRYIATARTEVERWGWPACRTRHWDEVARETSATSPELLNAAFVDACIETGVLVDSDGYRYSRYHDDAPG